MIARTALGKILLFMVFFVGIATGAILDNVYRTRFSAASGVPENRRADRSGPPDRGRRDREAMDKYLGLNEAQQKDVHQILEDTRSELRQLREQVSPQFKAIEEGSRARIRAILNDEQRRKLDEFRESHPGGRGRSPRGGTDKQSPSKQNNP